MLVTIVFVGLFGTILPTIFLLRFLQVRLGLKGHALSDCLFPLAMLVISFIFGMSAMVYVLTEYTLEFSQKLVQTLDNQEEQVSLAALQVSPEDERKVRELLKRERNGPDACTRDAVMVPALKDVVSMRDYFKVVESDFGYWYQLRCERVGLVERETRALANYHSLWIGYPGMFVGKQLYKLAHSHLDWDTEGFIREYIGRQTEKAQTIHQSRAASGKEQ